MRVNNRRYREAIQRCNQGADGQSAYLLLQEMRQRGLHLDLRCLLEAHSACRGQGNHTKLIALCQRAASCWVRGDRLEDRSHRAQDLVWLATILRRAGALDAPVATEFNGLFDRAVRALRAFADGKDSAWLCTLPGLG